MLRPLQDHSDQRIAHQATDQAKVVVQRSQIGGGQIGGRPAVRHGFGQNVGKRLVGKVCPRQGGQQAAQMNLAIHVVERPLPNQLDDVHVAHAVAYGNALENNLHPLLDRRLRAHPAHGLMAGQAQADDQRKTRQSNPRHGGLFQGHQQRIGRQQLGHEKNERRASPVSGYEKQGKHAQIRHPFCPPSPLRRIPRRHHAHQRQAQHVQPSRRQENPHDPLPPVCPAKQMGLAQLEPVGAHVRHHQAQRLALPDRLRKQSQLGRQPLVQQQSNPDQ